MKVNQSQLTAYFWLVVVAIIIVIADNTCAQDDIKLDTLFYASGPVETGEVVKITETNIEFRMYKDDLVYEIPKKKVKEIRLKNGRIIEFDYDKTEERKYDTWERESKIDDGPNTCLLIGGAAGVVLAVLLIVGAIAAD